MLIIDKFYKDGIEYSFGIYGKEHEVTDELREWLTIVDNEVDNEPETRCSDLNPEELEDFETRAAVFKKGVDYGSSTICMLKREDEIVGTAILYGNTIGNEYALYLENFIIKKEYRGQGLSKLVWFLVQLLARYTVPETSFIQLEVSPDNKKVIDMYIKFGFTYDNSTGDTTVLGKKKASEYTYLEYRI